MKIKNHKERSKVNENEEVEVHDHNEREREMFIYFRGLRLQSTMCTITNERGVFEHIC